MKKFFAIILCMVLMLSSLSVLAYENESKDDMLEQKLYTVKSRISDTDGYTDFNSNRTSYADGSYSYTFSWCNDSNEWLEVTINNDDVITYYYKSGESKVSKTPSLDYKLDEEIISAAKAHVYRLNPEMRDKLVFEHNGNADIYATMYTVAFYRTENGIKVQNDSGTISFSKDFAEVKNFRFSYTPGIVFENPDKLISSDSAVQSYKADLGYKLCYDIIYENNSQKAVLKYVPAYDSTVYIDALTAEVFDCRDFYASEEEYSNVLNDTAKLTGGGGSGRTLEFSEAELSEMSKIENLISTEEAEKSVRTNVYLDIPEDAELVYTSMRRNYYDKEVYTYYFDFRKDNEHYSASCNAKNGEVISFNRYADVGANSKDELAFEELEKLAKDAVQGLARKYFTDDSANTFAYDDTDEKTGIFKAVRFVNGVECLNNGLTIRIDKFSGKVNSYNLNYAEIEFPAAGDAISLNEAYEKLFANTNYEVVYMPLKLENNIVTGKLIYDFDVYDISMSAADGKLYSRVQTDEIITDYVDIEGHYAEDIINTLKRFRIGFTGGEFKPDEIMTQGEFVTWLAYVFDRSTTPVLYKSGTNYHNAYLSARTYDWISEEEIDQDALLSRETACIMMIKAMGHGSVASYDKIFVSSFGDVTDNIGYISILNAMGVVNGDGNGNFNPDKMLTRAESIIMIYNYLVNANK